MKKVPLFRYNTVVGYSIVDEECHEKVSSFRWHLNSKGYAVAFPAGHRQIFMHRVINETPDGMFTDHKNGNPLDNRKGNLRTCTKQQNAMNKKLSTRNTSGYRGVTRNLNPGTKHPWAAWIKVRGKVKRIGQFLTKKDAALAYDKMAREHFGEFAVTNFD